ncbi:MAG: hypothetical protein DDT39_01673 [Firmicutes bacterium]|nr:hypothetical protein [candidate division NPL-UPA2 bacterium]
MSTSSLSTLFFEQALEVLRKTEDGNQLARRDLALLQEVVNGAGQTLSERGLARWDYIVECVRDGSYAVAPCARSVPWAR